MSTTAEPDGSELSRPARSRPGGWLGLLTADRPAWRSRGYALLGVVVFAALSFDLVHRYLVAYPAEVWEVDIEVYREGAHSLLAGREVYDWLTGGPQWLPFTYPPFAALLGLPLAMFSFVTSAYLWALLQLALLWVGVGIAFRPFLQRFGARAGLVRGGICGLLLHLLPLADGIRFGQVNSVIVTLCLVDLVREREGRRWPRGSLVAIAAAIKLTPALFWVHWAVTRRWRPLLVSIATAAGVTLLTALFAPSASADFWTNALLDPGRLGPNAGASNQSLRGVLLRIGPSQGIALSLTWLLLVLIVGVAGFALSARLHQLGNQLGVVATVGMLAVLISPVSWVHHLHWGIVVIAALLGDGRNWRRFVAAAGVGYLLYLHMPWWGSSMVQNNEHPHWLGVLLENSYTLVALLSLVAMWWFLARGQQPAGQAEPEAQSRPAAEPEPAAPAGPTGEGEPGPSAPIRPTVQA